MNDEVSGVEVQGSQGSSAPPQNSDAASDTQRAKGDEEKKDSRGANPDPTSNEKKGAESKSEGVLKDTERKDDVRKDEPPRDPPKQAKGNPDPKEPPPKEEKSPPPDPDRQSRSAADDRWSSTTDRMFGANLNNGTINFNMEGDSDTASASFERDLKIIQTPPSPRTPADAAEVRRYMTLLRERRVLVVAHERRGQDDADSAMLSLVCGVRESEPTRTLATSGFDKTFPLHSFYESPGWPPPLCGSLIYLNRSADISSAAFFDNDSRVGMLREQLQKVDAHLIITVNAENRRFTQGAAYVDIWKLLAGAEATASSDSSSKYSSSLEIAIAICAALLPGLGTREFIEVVNSLTTTAAPPAGATPSTPGPKGGHPQSTTNKTPTREKRWLAGEHDSVLRELGVVFSRPEERRSEGALEAGFIFEDANQRAAMPAWVLSHFPVLIAGQIDKLADRYLSHASTTLFRNNFFNLLFQLEGFGLFRITASWLERHYQSLFARENPLECSRYFVELLVKTMNSIDGNTLVDTVVNSIVNDALQCERDLLEAVPEDLFATALQAVTPDSQDPTGQFWDVLVASEASRVLIQSAIIRLHLAAETLAELSRHRPGTVSEGIKSLLAPGALKDTRWSRHVAELQTAAPILRISYLGFLRMLERIIEKDIPLWVTFSRMMLGEDSARDCDTGRDGAAKNTAKSARRERSSSREQDKNDESPTAAELTHDCLNILAKRLSEIEPKALPDPLYEALFAEDRRARTGRLLAALIARFEDLNEDSIVWLYRALTTTLLARNKAAASTVSATLQDMMAPLRSGLPGSRRSAISRRAHEVQQHYFDRRNYFLAVGKRELLRVERERIEAMHIVIRALSGAKSATTTLSK